LPYCSRCRSEYRAGYTHCADCGVELVDELPEEIWEEVPEEEACEEPGPRREWLSWLVPRKIDPGANARCIKSLCWILIAVALYSLLHHIAISLGYYFQYRVWEQEEPVAYIGFIFFTLLDFENLLLIILALFLSASLMASHIALKFKLMLYFSLLMAIWHTASLVFFVIIAVQNGIWDDEAAVLAFVTGVFMFVMIILAGTASTILSRKLKTAVVTEGA
jgi:hypothetical protein